MIVNLTSTVLIYLLLFAFIDFYLLNIKIVHCIKNIIINYAYIDAHALATSANS